MIESFRCEASMFGKIVFSLTLILGLAGAARAEQLPLPEPGESLWGLGATGISCYQEPCPRYGVFQIHRDGRFELPLSRRNQPQPPPLRADKPDRDRIERSFETGGCVMAEGHFEGRTLVVRRVWGDCHDL